MSDPNGGADEGRRNRRPATAGFSAARGAALVAIAVIIGVVLLQAIDDEKSCSSLPVTAISTNPLAS